MRVVSHTLTADDAEAVALFATHVGSPLEVAGTIETLERTNRELAACHADLARTQQYFVRAGAPADKLRDAELLASMAAEESIRLNGIVADLQQSAARVHRRR